MSFVYTKVGNCATKKLPGAVPVVMLLCRAKLADAEAQDVMKMLYY